MVGTNANYDHFNYRIESGDLFKVTAVDGDLPTYSKVGNGYSGKGDGLNNPNMQAEPGAKGKANAGPIPEGAYTIGKIFDNTGHTGPGSMRLAPSSTNNMHGRSGFLMHGDNSSHNSSGSEGCIVMPPSVRNTVSDSGIKHLEVTAW